MEQIIKKRDRFVACCSYCGTFLQEIYGNCDCNVTECSYCGKDMAAVVKKGKVTVFEFQYSENNPKIRVINHAVRFMKKREDLRSEIS